MTVQVKRVCHECLTEFATPDGSFQWACDVCEERDRRKQDEKNEAIAEEQRWRILGCDEDRLADMWLDEGYDKAVQPKAFTAIRAFVDDWPHKQALILLGAPGTGKTHLMVAACSELIKHKKVNAAYRSMVKLSNQWKRAQDWGAFHRSNVEPLLAIKLLALDELGREARTDQMAAELDELIDARYINNLPTLLGSNLPLPMFKQYVGESLWSRLDSWATIVVMQGNAPENDYRRRLKVG